MAEKTYKAVKSAKLSNMYEERYVIVDIQSGEILDDAQGYGYKSIQKAYAGYGYKNRDKSKDAAREKKHQAVYDFCKTHKGFVRMVEQYAFEIAKGSWGPEDKVDAAFIAWCFESQDIHPKDFGFTPRDFLRYWGMKPPKQEQKRKHK